MAALEQRCKSPMAIPRELQGPDYGQLVTTPLTSPRLLEFGSPTRGGGSGLCSVSYTNKSDYDVARFFTARDILDLINQLHKSAKIAIDEATGIQGNEQVNRIKAKCSKMCGLANRLIDLYVATIKAKVARILRKLGLGLDKGQELLYHHLTVLQGLVDQAFASFNAMQYADAARIKQAKLHAGIRRENSAVNLTWRSPTERKPPFRPGSHGSAPQPPQHLDVKDLLLEARKKFMIMAEELVDLKDKLIVLDRARIQAAIMAAEAEGEVPDPLPSLKAASGSLTYGFNTRYLTEGGCCGPVAHREAQPPSPRDIRSLRAFGAAQSPRTSRLVRSSLEASPVTGMAPAPTQALAATHTTTQAGTPQGCAAAFRGLSEPGGGVAEDEARDAWMCGSPYSAEAAHRSRMVISDRGGSAREREQRVSSGGHGGSSAQSHGWRAFAPTVHRELGDPAAAHRSLQAAFLREGGGGVPMALVSNGGAGREGECRPHLPVGVWQDAGMSAASTRSSNPGSCFPWTVSSGTSVAGDDTTTSACINYDSQMQARDVTTGALVRQAANMAGQVVCLEQEKEEGREALWDLVTEALRLVERDPSSLHAVLMAQSISMEDFEEAVARCKAQDAEPKDLQSMLRTCLNLLGDQLRQFAAISSSRGDSAIATPSSDTHPGTLPDTNAADGNTPMPHPVCARCGELAAFLDELLPMINSASSSARDRSTRDCTADLGAALPSAHGPPELAPDGSQDEVVLLPVAGDLDDSSEAANEVLVVVLQRLTTVLDRLHQLEDVSQELEERLERERRERVEAEAQAARLKEDRDDADASLAATRERLLASERQLEQLRAQLVDATCELQAKAAEVNALQERLFDDGSKRVKSPPTSGLGFFGVGMENATEMELEGLRVEHENLRAKTELQGTEIRQLQSEVSGLRAARDKLLEELQDMHSLLQLSRGPIAEEPGPSTCRTRSNPGVAAASTTEEGKAAARASAARGAPTAAARGSPHAGKSRMSSLLSASVDASSLSSGTHGRAGGVRLSSDRALPSPAAKSRSGREVDLCSSSICSLAAAMSPTRPSKKPARRGIPMPPGMPMGPPPTCRSASSGCSTPRESRENFGAIARLEEVQVQLAQAEAARQLLEYQLQAAQSVIASKDSELSTANLMLHEYERLSRVAATPTQPRTARKKLALGSPRLLDLIAPINFDAAAADNGHWQVPSQALPHIGDGDGVVVVVAPRSRGASAVAAIAADADAIKAGTGAAEPLPQPQEAAEPAAVKDGRMDLVSQVVMLQAECEELTRRTAALDEERARAELNAEERAAELQATREYIQELEEEAELLREMADKTSMQMAEKDEELIEQEDALLEARDALCCTQEECDLQAQRVEEQAAQLEAAQRQLEDATAQVAELQRHGAEQSAAEAEALTALHKEIALLQSQLAASQAALVVANDELEAARGAVSAAEEALAEQRRTSQDLREQLEAVDATRQELAVQVAAAEEAHADLTHQLHDSLASRQELEERLEAAAAAQLEVAAKLSLMELAYAEAQAQLEQSETAQAELVRQVEAAEMGCSEADAALASAEADRLSAQAELASCQAAMQAQAEQLAGAEAVRLGLVGELQGMQEAIKGLEVDLQKLQASRAQLQVGLAAAVAGTQRLSEELSRSAAAGSIMAAQIATTRVARDVAYGRSVNMEAALQQLQSQLQRAEAEAAVRSEHVAALEQQLQRAQERELRLQEQAAQDAAARAAEAADLVAAHQEALATVQARFAAVRAEAEMQASRVKALEAALADAAEERERLLLQATTAAAHSEMQAMQLEQVRAENAGLEEQLAVANTERTAQLELSTRQAAQLLLQQESATAAEVEQARLFAAEMAVVKVQLEAAISVTAEQASRSAAHVLELEARLAAAHAENSKQAESYADRTVELETLLEAARAALQEHAERSAASVAVLEQQLTEARTASSKQADAYTTRVGELEARLAEAHTAAKEQEERTAARVANLERQLEEARVNTAHQVDLSTAHAVELSEQLAGAREEMAEQAQLSAVQAAELEAQLATAHAAIAAHVERSNMEVHALVAQLEAVRREGAEKADRDAQHAAQLEAHLAAVLAEQAEQNQRSTAEVAHLEARLSEATAKSTELARRAGAHAGELELQLAAAAARNAEQAELTFVQTFDLTAQLAAARAELTQQAKRGSQEAAALVMQLEVARAEVAEQTRRFAAQAASLEAQVDAARAECVQRAERSTAAIAELEAQLAAARAEIAEHMNRSSAHVAALEEQLVAAHTAFAGKAIQSAEEVAELELQLAATRREVADTIQRLTAQAAALEGDLSAARAQSTEQARQSQTRAAELGQLLTQVRAEKDAEAERYAAQAAALAAQLSAARDESARAAECSTVVISELQVQLTAARMESVVQVERVRALESKLRDVLTLLSVATTIQEQQRNDVLQLQAQGAHLQAKLDQRDTDIQQLKASLLALQVTLQEREEAVADRERELEKARTKLAAAVAVMEHSQATVERLTADVAAATAAVECAAVQQQPNLARVVHEQARFRDLLADLMSVSSSQSRLVAGLREEVSELRGAGRAASVSGQHGCQGASTQLTLAAVATGEAAAQSPRPASPLVTTAEAAAQLSRPASPLVTTAEAAAWSSRPASPLVTTAEAAAQSSRPASPLVTTVEAAAQSSRPASPLVATAEAVPQASQLSPTCGPLAAEPSLSIVATQVNGPYAWDRLQSAGAAQVYTLEEGLGAVGSSVFEEATAVDDSQELATDLAGIQRVLVAQQGAATGLLESLKARLAVADADLCQAKACVTELQSQLADAQARMTAAELAAASADAERRRVEAQLTTALEDSSDGRALVQQLTADLARWREEVDQVRSSLLAKQALLDQLDHPSNPASGQQPSPRQASRTQAGGQEEVHPSTDAADEDGDEELADDFFEGVIWGVGLGALQGRRQRGPGSVDRGDIQPASPDGCRVGSLTCGRSVQRSQSSKGGGIASRLDVLHINVMELMTRRWQGAGGGGHLCEQAAEETAAASPETLVTRNWVADDEA